MISYAVPEMADSLRDKILDRLAGRKINVLIDDPLFFEGIENKSNTLQCKRLVAKVRKLYSDEEVTSFLFRFGIPADRIQSLIDKNVSLRMLKSKTYETCFYSQIDIYAAENMAMYL